MYIIDSLQQMIALLQSNMTLALVIFTILGLCVGSFLNVVIHRKPLMMFADWRKASVDILSQESDIGEKIDEEILSNIKAAIEKDTEINLSYPASRCPTCGHKIRSYENIPVISWLMLLGKCSGCKSPISFRYPLVETITGILSFMVIYTFGVTGAGLSALLLIWILVALTGIDFDTHYLPDDLTYPLIFLGLLASTQGWFTTPVSAILGLICGYMILWSISKIFFIVVKKQGMGGGDFKLLAALGAWFGVIYLPLIILLSSAVGIIVGAFYYIKHRKSLPIAFGPYLAIAGVITLFYGSEILNWYLISSGLA